MAQECGFFNAEYHDGEYDRVYNAEQFAAYFATFIGNGIFGGSMDELVVTAKTQNDMSVDVGSGKAWINGWWYRNTETYNMSIALADGILNRKDIIVLRWGNAERDMWLQVVQGEPSIEAVAPVIRRDADYYDLELCEIDVPAGTSKITQAQIKDTRLDNNVCGFVTGLVDQIDTTALYLQFNAQFGSFMETSYEEFDTWFQHAKDILDEEVAVRLQGEIDEINENTSINTSDFVDETSIEVAIKNLADSFTEDGTYSGRFKATNTPSKWFGFQLDRYDGYASGYIISTTDSSERYTFRYVIGVDSQATISPFRSRHTETISPSSRGTVDMGEYHDKRYIDLSDVPNVNTETYSFPANDTGATKDLGVNNNYRYVNGQNVYNKGVADGRVGYIVKPTATKTISANGSNIDVLNYVLVNVSVWNTLNIQNWGTFTSSLSKTVSVGSLVIIGNWINGSGTTSGLTLLGYYDYAGFQCGIYRAKSSTISITKTAGGSVSYVLQIYRS